jgi:hypothetical protein
MIINNNLKFKILKNNKHLAINLIHTKIMINNSRKKNKLINLNIINYKIII